MNKLIAAIIVLYSIIYYVYPNQNNFQEIVPEVKSEIKPTISLSYEDGKITLTEFKEDNNERYWGTLNNYRFMIYKNIEDFIYVNGQFHQVNGEWQKNKFLLPEKEALNLFNMIGEKGKYASKEKQTNVICKEIKKEKVLDYLKDPNIPIENAFITKEEGQLPGASRDYRNGKHEGFDWYPGAIGTEITKETKVHPIYEGTIVRIDKNYTELEQEYRESLLEEAATRKNTSQETLDKLRGRQVWVQSKNGVLVHYAHLDSVNDKLEVGDQVKTDDWIGKVGNSGTSNGALGTNEDLHLHSDILVCGKNFWEYGDINEMNLSLIEIFDKEISKKQEKVW